MTGIETTHIHDGIYSIIFLFVPIYIHKHYDIGNLLGVNVPDAENLLMNNGVFSLFIPSSNIDYQLLSLRLDEHSW